MKVHKTDAQTFQSINTAKIGRKLMERIDSNQRFLEFARLDRAQNTNPINIELSMGEHSTLIGKILDKEGKILYTKQENVIRGILNLSPTKFISKLCRKADKFNAKK